MFTNKKRLILLVGFFVLIFGILFFLISNKKQVLPQPTTTPPSISTLLPSPRYFEPDKIQGLIYEDPQHNFDIAQMPSTKEYIISILGSPFSKHREEVEKTFLKLLKINQTQACNLKVSITTPYFANPDESGKTYPLSFCSHP